MLERARDQENIVLTPEQIAAAPFEVRRWLQRILGGDSSRDRRFILERDGVCVSSDGLAICSLREITSLLHKLKDDFLSCQILFQLGCEFYNPITAEHRRHVVQLNDFLHHTDAQNIFDVDRCLKAINSALREVRRDPDAVICHCNDHAGFEVHETTQHNIYRLWRRLVRLPPPRQEIASTADSHRFSASASHDGPISQPPTLDSKVA